MKKKILAWTSERRVVNLKWRNYSPEPNETLWRLLQVKHLLVKWWERQHDALLLLCLQTVMSLENNSWYNAAVISSQLLARQLQFYGFLPITGSGFWNYMGNYVAKKILLILSWRVLKADSIWPMKSKQHLIWRVTRDDWWVHSSDSWGTEAITAQRTWLAAREIHGDCWFCYIFVKQQATVLNVSKYYCFHSSFFTLAS